MPDHCAADVHFVNTQDKRLTELEDDVWARMIDIHLTGTFYGASVALAYVLFVAWPDAYVALGYDVRLTPQLVVAVINIHHFVVDAYVWRLRRDPNYRTVVDGAVPAGA